MHEGKRDYGHFLSDKKRQNYVSSMPKTLNNPDVHVSLNENGVIKEYLIKKYKDPQIAQDIWDVIVKKDGTVVTKIPRSGKHGSNYARNLIESGDNWGTRQSSAYSKTPLGQTASDAFQYALPETNIPQNGLFVKPNILQLQSLKREIGKDAIRGEANFTKEQLGRNYDAIRSDVFDSVSKNALPEKQDFVTKALAKADSYYKAQQMGQSPKSLLKNYANDKKPASGIASNFLRDLKAKNVNTKAENTLLKKADNPTLLKEEAMSHIRTRNEFNQLSPSAKKII